MRHGGMTVRQTRRSEREYTDAGAALATIDSDIFDAGRTR